MKHIVALLLTLNVAMAFGRQLSNENQKLVLDFIKNVKNNNIEALSNKIAYPFRRGYPIKAIENKQEFVGRYKEVFDDSLVKMITTSDITKDWSEMGWRGIMLRNGELWLDVDGRLRGVNYQSAFEKKRQVELIEAEKKTLHESIRDFEQPCYVLETNEYRVRIDQLSFGDYRFAMWPINSKMSEKPLKVIYKGNLVHEGSGGNHHYDFYDWETVYVCYINVLGNDETPPAELTIFKPSTKQRAKIVR